MLLVLSIFFALHVANAHFNPKEWQTTFELNKYFHALTSKDSSYQIENSLIKSILDIFLDYHKLMVNQKFFNAMERKNAVNEFEKVQSELSFRLQSSLTVKNLISTYEFMRMIWQREAAVVKAKEFKIKNNKKFDHPRKHIPFRWG
jgi:hypothetical protein